MMCLDQNIIPSKAIGAPKGTMQTCSCGKCEACRTKHKNDLVYRIECELRTYNVSRYCTFTYSPEDLPFLNTKYEFTGKETVMNTHKCFIRWSDLVDSKLDFDGRYVMSLMPTDVRNITTYFRKNGIRYYICGEYGDDVNGSHRPHYHAIVVSDGTLQALDYIIYKSWSHGIVDSKPVFPERVEYVVKDMLKEVELPEDPRAVENFHRWSNGFGLHGFLQDLPYISKDPLKRFVWLGNGRKARVPRYFKEIFFKQDYYTYYHQQIYENEEFKRKEEQFQNYVQSFAVTNRQQNESKALRNYLQDFDRQNRDYVRITTRKRRKGC